MTRTAEDVLQVLLPRWRASLPSSIPPVVVDTIIRRNRESIAALITRVLAAMDGRGGPRTVEDFAAFDILIPRNRLRDQSPDDAVIVRVLRRVDAVLAEGYGELGVLQNQGREYVDTRAEAILLRKAGWDAVPLLTILPALAVVAGGNVVAVRSASGTLRIHPGRTGTLNHLQADIFRAETKVVELADELDVAPNTRERLARYATHLWERARSQGEIVLSSSPTEKRDS